LKKMFKAAHQEVLQEWENSQGCLKPEKWQFYVDLKSGKHGSMLGYTPTHIAHIVFHLIGISIIHTVLRFASFYKPFVL
jgi:hypothetical protein